MSLLEVTGILPNVLISMSNGVRGKRRRKCRCYNPKKPEKWHLKVYALNCSKSGYLVRFKIYRGKGEVRPEGVSATAYPIHALLKPPKFHHRSHILFTDNWYTSLQYVKIGEERGIHSAGTIKANRKGLPLAPKRFPVCEQRRWCEEKHGQEQLH